MTKEELLKKKDSFEKKLKDPKFEQYKKQFNDGLKVVNKELEKLGKDVEKEVEKVVEKPKAKKTTKPRAKKKTTAKKTPTKADVEKAKADLKNKTGKTEEECEDIIEQYKALRTKAQARKKKETATATKDKKRVETLKKKGDIIPTTNVKTADATIETAKEEVVEKIEKEVEVVKEKAEKKAEKEVKKEMPKATKTEQKKEVAKKVEKEVKAKTKTIVKRIVIDTTKLINSISDELGKLDKDSQKEFLIKLRSDVDKLLKKYAVGGLTDGGVQVMNITQSNLSASSVNPTLFAKGGSIADSPRIYVADLEAYNNGELKGEFLDLDDYSDADELMDAIQEVVGEDGEYAIHDYENIPSSMYSEYMGREDFEQIYEAMELADRNGLPFDVVIDAISEYGESILDSYQGSYKDMEDFAYELVEQTGGIGNFNNPEYYVYMTDTDKRLTAQDITDNYLDDIRDDDGGRRIIEEADMDIDAFDDASDDMQEEMIDEAYDMLSERMYDEIIDELDDPYDYFVEQQGMYSREDFFDSNIVRIDYDALANDLEQDYISIDGEDGMVYIFDAYYKRGGKIRKGKRSKHSYMQDRRRVSSESWEKAYQKRKK